MVNARVGVVVMAGSLPHSCRKYSRAKRPPMCAPGAEAATVEEARMRDGGPGGSTLDRLEAGLQGLGRAVRATAVARFLRPCRDLRIRQHRRQRPLPALAAYERPCALLVCLARRARGADESRAARHQRCDPDLPLSPGDRRPGAGYAR